MALKWMRLSRPDDFKVVMALGDSITAGFLAKSPRDADIITDSLQHAQSTFDFRSSILNEYRGVSYPIGNDEGAITIASILSHYSPNLTGVSIGHHPVGSDKRKNEDQLRKDGLNVAVSGSKAKDLIGQVRGASLRGAIRLGELI